MLIAAHIVSLIIIRAIGRNPTERAAPNLLPSATVRDPLPMPPKPVAAEATTEAASQRHILPKDLPNTLNISVTPSWTNACGNA